MYCIVLSLIQGYFKSSCGDVSRHTGLGTSAASPPRMGRHSHPVWSDPKWIQSNKVKWPVKWHERLPQSSLSISSFWMISGIAWAKWAKNQIFRWYRDSAAGGCLQGCATKVGVKLLGTMMDNVEIWRLKHSKHVAICCPLIEARSHETDLADHSLHEPTGGHSFRQDLDVELTNE